MKQKTYLTILFSLAFFLLTMVSALAVWEEDFEAASLGALDGYDSWTATPNTLNDIIINPLNASNQVGEIGALSSTTGVFVKRPLGTDSVTTGDVFRADFYLNQQSTAQAYTARFILEASDNEGNLYMQFIRNGAGWNLYSLGGATTIVAGLTDSNWYTIEVFPDISTDTFTIKLDGTLYDNAGAGYAFNVLTSSTLGFLNFYDKSNAQDEILIDNICAGTIAECSGAAPEPAANTNFSTPSVSSFSFDTPLSIGVSYGVVNTLTFNNTITSTEPYYFASSITTFGGSGSAECRLTIDGVEVVTNTRTLSLGTYGNIPLVSPGDALSLGSHTINTECLKIGGSNYVVNNSQLTQVLLYDSNSNSTITTLAFDDAGPIPLTTTDSYLGSFAFNTSNTTNTTNKNFLITQGVVNYNYVVDDNITAYFKIEETGETCGPYTRGGLAGSVGSVGASCAFSDLNSSTTYNLSLYGYTQNGVGSFTDLSSNLFEILVNETASSIAILNKTLAADTLTLIEEITLSNHLGGSYNLFSEASIMVSDDTEQDAYFYLSNSVNTSDFYRTINSYSGNIVIQNVFSESGTANKSISLYGYCPSGCDVTGGSLNAFVTDTSVASTGLFNITAQNTWNSSTILEFNATIGGTTLSTTNGTILALAQGNVNVVVEAENFFSNTTLHDTTTNLLVDLAKYTEVTATNFQGGEVTNFTININGSAININTTNGLIYFPVVDGTLLNINGDTIAGQTDAVNKSQSYNFIVYEENSLLISFRDSVTNELILNASMDYFSTLDSGERNTTNGTIYLSLLNPVTYTFRVNASGYVDNIYFTTITQDTFNAFVIYLNPNTSTTSITFSIVDGGASPVQNAQVKALKYYVGDNTYRVVASGITNPGGETKLDLITENNFYKYVVVLNDVVVETTAPSIITATTIIIQVVTEEDALEDYEEWRGINSNLKFNELTKNFRLDYTDSQSINREVCMAVYEGGFSTDSLLSTTCVTGTSGTILAATQNVSSGRFYAIATTTIDGENWIIAQEAYIYENVNIGSSGLIGQMFLTIIMSLSGFIAIELIFILAPLSIIIGGLVGLHSISLGVTIPLVIVGIIIMFILRRNA